MDEHPGGGGVGMATPRQQQAPQQGNNNVNPQIGGGGGALMVQQQQDEMPRPQQYTIPGILHYIQHEWARFEMERAHWEVERAELQVSNSTHLLARVLTLAGWVVDTLAYELTHSYN